MQVPMSGNTSIAGAQQVKNPTSVHEEVGSIPGVAQWLRGAVLLQAETQSQMWLGSGVVTLVQAGSFSSDSTPGLGTSVCCGCSPKKKKKKREREKSIASQLHRNTQMEKQKFVILTFPNILDLEFKD